MSEKQAVSPELTREQLEAAISAKSWQDKNFLDELRRDPKGTLEKEQGITLPANLEIRLVEETQNVVYLRLQASPEELSDEMLDQVAGGAWWENGGGSGADLEEWSKKRQKDICQKLGIKLPKGSIYD